MGRCRETNNDFLPDRNDDMAFFRIEMKYFSKDISE